MFDDFDDVLKHCTAAWKHSTLLEEEKYRYLYLTVRGEDLSLFHHDPDLYNKYKGKIEAQALAARVARVDMADLCFFDLLPENQLIEYFSARATALKWVFDNTKKEEDYDILHKAHVLTENISLQRVNFCGSVKKNIKYNIFGSATGRLTTMKDSVPVLTLKKEERSRLLPQNDLYVDLDLNGAEIRTLLALSGIEQPEEDIHEWNMNNACRGLTTREEAKARMFAWLYNPDSEDYMLERYYNKQVYRDFFDGENVTTPYGRHLSVEERKAQNYLLQSTTSDVVIESAYKIMKLLEGTRSFVAFTMHDSVVLDFCREDYRFIREIKDIFEKNRFGRFLSRVRIGKNFGSMRELEI